MAVLGAGFALKRHPSGRGVLVVDGNGVAQPWPELPSQIERFLELTFLVVRREEAQVTECWCPDEAVKKALMAFSSVQKAQDSELCSLPSSCHNCDEPGTQNTHGIGGRFR